MPGFRDIAVRWYRKAFGAPKGADIRDEGLATVLDGNSAVALSEATIASHAVLGGSPPSAAADQVWLRELGRDTRNLFGEALAADTAEGPRGIVAAATGLALAGRRATAFLSGPDIAAAQDLLISAAGKHAPFVLHVGARAANAHGSALGSGHDAVHLSADSGCFMLVAANVQEAADFTYIARRVAEESLVPGIVVADGEQTANAVQDVCLLSPNQVTRYLGAAREEIGSPTPAQKLLFGETRRRLPAWHDLDEPMLTGALFGTQDFALGALGRGPFFDAFVEESLASAFDAFAETTGRSYESVSGYRLDDAQTVFVAMGAAIETARVAADAFRKHHDIRAGVLGIHAIRPFPADLIANALAGKEWVFVLERADARLTREPPLSREIRACLGSSGDIRLPQCTPVVYGVGGLPLRVADLVQLCTEERPAAPTPVFLGIAFDDASGEQPKRDVLLDTLRRAYPDLAARAVRAPAADIESTTTGVTTIAVAGNSGEQAGDILGAAVALRHKLEGGRIRSRAESAWQADSGAGMAWIAYGDNKLQDPGDAPHPDITLDVAGRLVTVNDDGKNFEVPPAETSAASLESLLGGLFGVLIASRRVESARRRIINARREMLESLAPDQRDELIDAFEAGLDRVSESSAAAGAAPDASGRWQGETPAAVRHLGRDDDHLASLPRFWDQAGVLYRDGTTDRLTADPFFATGTMPPLSSTFSDLARTRSALPVFDPDLCTGCGLCWTLCPDSAIGAAVVSPAAFLDAGIGKTGAEPVRQVASKLASRMIASSKKAPRATFGELLDESFAWLIEKAPLPDERKQAIEEGVARIAAEFGALPIAVAKPFFQDAEARRKDSAEFLSLAINPDACKACGICVAACEPVALGMREQDAELLDDTRRLWSAWAATPDTGSDTLERVAEDPDIGAMASILLSRYCQFALAGGDPAEAGSGEKTAVRLALAATEFHQQPLVQRFAASLAAAGDEVTALIRGTVSGTLAVDDLDAVAEKLKTTASPRVDVRELADSVGATAGDHSIDTDYLLRLIELADRIATAHHGLVAGEHGLGRARYGLAVAGRSTATWAGAFPHNPFQAPVLIDMTGDAAQLAAGLIEGHLDETTELVRLLRLARLEIDQPDGLEWKRDALSSLRWTDLDEEEYDLCPPLVLVGSDEMLAGQGLSQLVWLLNSGLPVKVLVLSTMDFGLIDAPTNNPRASLGLLALAQRNAFVAQASVGNPKHLGESVLQALGYEGPALIQVYAASPTRDGFAADATPEQARLAMRSRALPLFRYDPGAGGVFGSRISLDGNPQPDVLLAQAGDDAKPVTPADWSLGQARFSDCFQALAEDAAAPLPLHEWLQLDARNRNSKTPYVATGDGEDEQRYSMTPAMLRTCESCLENWQTLQELAGVVTPFTTKLEEEIRAAVAAEHQAELDAQKQAAAKELLEAQQKTQADIASRIRSRLLELASRKKD